MNGLQKLIAYLKIAVSNIAVLKRNITGLEAYTLLKVLEDTEEHAKKYVNKLSELAIAEEYTEPTIAEAVLQYQSEVLPAQKKDARQTLMDLYKILDKAFTVSKEAVSEEGEAIHEAEVKKLQKWLVMQTRYYIAMGIDTKGPKPIEDKYGEE